MSRVVHVVAQVGYPVVVPPPTPALKDVALHTRDTGGGTTWGGYRVYLVVPNSGK
jgi:hypothetical protein